MTPKSTTLLHLSALADFAALKSSREALPFSLLPGGVPQGSLMEISGEAGGGKTEVLLRLLAENPALRVVWIERDFTFYPCALQDSRFSDISLDRILFIDAGASRKDPLWIAQRVLRSQLFGIVVLCDSVQEEIMLRRLQLSARRCGTCVILLREQPTLQKNWPIAIQLQVSRDLDTGEPFLEVLRHTSRNGNATCLPLLEDA